MIMDNLNNIFPLFLNVFLLPQGGTAKRRFNIL